MNSVKMVASVTASRLWEEPADDPGKDNPSAAVLRASDEVGSGKFPSWDQGVGGRVRLCSWSRIVKV
jgi:hypothetical protein